MEDGRRSKSYNQQSTDWNPVENDKTLYGEDADVSKLEVRLSEEEGNFL
jgi:hypothetical protein